MLVPHFFKEKSARYHMKRYVMAQKKWVASDQPAHLHSLVSLFCNIQILWYLSTETWSLLYLYRLICLHMAWCHFSCTLYIVLFPEMSHVVCDQTKSSLLCNIKMGLFIITMVWGYVQFIRITTGPLCVCVFFFSLLFVLFSVLLMYEGNIPSPWWM